MSEPTLKACWARCEWCDEFWCNAHQEHAHSCPCPAIEEWDKDPYAVIYTRAELDEISSRRSSSEDEGDTI